MTIEEQAKHAEYRAQGTVFETWLHEYTDKVTQELVKVHEVLGKKMPVWKPPPWIAKGATPKPSSAPVLTRDSPAETQLPRKLELSKALAAPPAHARPTQSPIDASVPVCVHGLQHVDEIGKDLTQSQIRDALIELGYAYEEHQLENIQKELYQLYKYNVVARQDETFKSNYDSWNKVNADMYGRRKDSDAAWNLQKTLLKHIQAKRKRSLSIPRLANRLNFQ